MDIGNVYAALVQCACSMQAACRQCACSVHAALNPPNRPGPGPVFLHYLHATFAMTCGQKRHVLHQPN